MPGGYIDFINSMLNLRNQRLQEEKAKAEMRQEQQQQMMKMASGISQQIGSAFQGYQENQMANRMMSEYGMGAQAAPPRAGAVNVPWSNQRAATMPDMYPAGRGTGGMAELKMRIAMEDFTGKKAGYERAARGEERAEDYLGLAKQREGRTSEAETERLNNAAANLEIRRDAAARADEVARLKAEQKVVDDAMTSFKNASPKFQEQAKNAEAYNKGVTASLQAMSGPYATQESYLQGLQKIDALYAGAESQGLKVDKPKIATWEDMEAARIKQQAIDAANRGDWNPFTDDAARAAALQKELQEMPGYRQNPLRIDIENYLATPSMARPEPPDIEALRAKAQTATPAQAATASAPAIRTVSPDEGAKLIGKPVRSGQKFTDPVTKEVIIIQ